MTTQHDGASGAPLVSVIVPAHNAAPFIDQCLRSILEQSHERLQIIVVDDASTDETAARVTRRLSDPRLSLTSLTTNRGLSGARNAGLGRAAGDFVTFVDADDWLELRAIEIALTHAQTNSADIVLWSYVREFRGGSAPRLLSSVLGSHLPETSLKGDEVRDVLLRRLVGPIGAEVADPGSMDSLVTAWGKLYRADIIRGMRFANVIWEDGIYNLKAFDRASSVVVVDDILLHYRKPGPSSLSRRARVDQIQRRTESLNLVNDFLTERGLGESWTRAWSNRVALSVLGIALKLATSEDTLGEQAQALRIALDDSLYAEALTALEGRLLPVHWRLFFFLAQRRRSREIMLLARVMNRYLSR